MKTKKSGLNMSKSAWNHILFKVEESISLLPENLRESNWLIAVSGGLDSMTLLHAVFAKHSKCVVAHVNYKKRGLDSDLDEKLVEQTCFDLGIPFEKTIAPLFKSGNFQDQARKFRYDFFEEVLKKHKAKLIVLAHHKDDAVENLLFRTLRGSYPQAILGPSVVENNRFRPFLGLNKHELKQGLQEKGGNWREDVSNDTTDFNRNWLRNVVIPEFDKRFLGWQVHLQEKAKLEQDFVEHYLAHHADKLIWIDDVLSLNLSLFESLTERILLALVHQKLAEKKVYVTNHSLQEALTLQNHQKGKKATLNGDWIALREEKTINFLKEISEKTSKEWKIGSENEWTSLQLKSYEAIKSTDWKREKGCISFDANKLRFPIHIRAWKIGDRIHPLGLNGSKLVSDLITAAKVPNQIKHQILVLSDFDDVIHAVIFPQLFCISNRTSEISKITEQSLTILQLKPN